MSKKLYEFTALIECSVIIAADNEKVAREEVETYEKAWIETGDFTGVAHFDLAGVRSTGTEDDLNDLAHVVI